jgi:hypothetical protein
MIDTILYTIELLIGCMIGYLWRSYRTCNKLSKYKAEVDAYKVKVDSLILENNWHVDEICNLQKENKQLRKGKNMYRKTSLLVK